MSLTRTDQERRTDQALSAVVKSFTAAVFDIYEWTEGEGTDEPRLCFSSAGNAALDELLKQPAAGVPVGVLLGPPPEVHHPNRQRWLQERGRLWTYATTKSAPHPPGAQNTVARKVGLSCSDAHIRPLEALLFIRPGSEGCAFFGLLVSKPSGEDPSGESLWMATGKKLMSSALLSHRPTRAKSKASSISSLSSVSDTTPVPHESAANRGEVRVWTSACEPGLPILKCSAGFTFLAGPSVVHLPLSSLIRDKTEVEMWTQRCVNIVEMGTDETVNSGDSQRAVRLRPLGAANMVEFGATCTIDPEQIRDFLETTEDGGDLDLQITSTSITQFDIKRKGHVSNTKMRKL